jgi:hypothetical protein
MVDEPEHRRETPKWRTLSLLAAFALLIGVGVVTVLLPELEDDPTDSDPVVESRLGGDPVQE